MAARAARNGNWDYPAGLQRLVAAALIGGAAWALSLEAGYALVKPACRADRIIWLTVVNALALAGTFVGLWIGRASWMRLRGAAIDEGVRPIDSLYFMAVVAIGLNAIFALLITLSTVPQLLRLPCE